MLRLKLKTHLFTRHCNSGGFTLIELMIVVVIIGILSGIMIPNYMRSRERAVDKQAKAILSLIRAAERNYKMETGGYFFIPAYPVSVSDINSNLNLDLVNDGNWEYGLGGSASDFSATMKRTSGGYTRTWTISANSVGATCSGNCP